MHIQGSPQKRTEMLVLNLENQLKTLPGKLKRVNERQHKHSRDISAILQHITDAFPRISLVLL